MALSPPGAKGARGSVGSLARVAIRGMGGLLRWDAGWVLSNSPETLLDVRLGPSGVDVARSWPIKGTRARGGDPERDEALRRALSRSAKDRAEHVMIVDLVRNDLGRLAVPGTVAAAAEPTVVSLPTVHHLVSEVVWPGCIGVHTGSSPHRLQPTKDFDVRSVVAFSH